MTDSYKCDAMAYDRKSLHSYTTIDFCLDEIGKIDWVHHFVNLKELTVVNQSVSEIDVSPRPNVDIP